MPINMSEDTKGNIVFSGLLGAYIAFPLAAAVVTAHQIVPGFAELTPNSPLTNQQALGMLASSLVGSAPMIAGAFSFDRVFQRIMWGPKSRRNSKNCSVMRENSLR